jgi:holo-[acyl-carrier protein] synthase
MRIIGIGTDIVECVRIAEMIRRHGEVFLAHVFTEREIGYCRSRRKATEHFAARVAAKEAVLKSFGTKPGSKPNWSEIEVINDPGDQPRVELYGSTREAAAAKQVGEIFISLSHSRTFAIAFATAVGHDKQ